MKKGKRTSPKNKAIRTSLRAPVFKMVIGGLLFCSGFLFLLSMLPFHGEHNVLRLLLDALHGVCGGTWFFFFPALLMIIGVKVILKLYHDVSLRNSLLLFGIYVFSLALMTIVTTVGSYGNLMSYIASQTSGRTIPSYSFYLQFAYDYGASDLQGQGALGMLIAYPLWRFLGTIGSAALLSVLILILAGVLLNLHPREWINQVSNWSADRRNAMPPDEEPVYTNPVQEARPAAPAGSFYQAPQPIQEAPVWQDDQLPQQPVPPVPSQEEGYYPVSSEQYYVENFGNASQEPSVRTNQRSKPSAPAFTPEKPAAASERIAKPPVFPVNTPEAVTEPLTADIPDISAGMEPQTAGVQTQSASASKPEPSQSNDAAKQSKSFGLKWPEFKKNKENTQNASAEAPETKPKPRQEEQHSAAGSWLEQLKQKKREADMAPADSQLTQSVTRDGAKPVFTGNAVEESFEHVPISPSAYTPERSGGRMDGTVKEEMPAIQVFSDVQYHFPPIELLHEGINFNTQDHTQEDQQRAQKIEETLRSFNIESKVMQIMHGPAITRFAIQIAPGIRVQRVTGMADNLALSLATKHVRVEAPIQGTNFIGIEVPNKLISTVSLREVLDSKEMRSNKSPLAVSLGKDIAGVPVVCDLSKMPHLLIAGATGSGKSVCIHSIVCSLLYRSSPKDVRLIMVDPKQVELSVYNDVPHLLIPVVTDVRKAAGALGWVVQEMQDRYAKFKDCGVRNLEGYNKQPGIDQKLPHIVVIIDEMADLMDVCRKDVEESIRRLAALARAAGIYMVLATQRPSVDVITGVIKNNIPSRIAFAVSSGIDSRTILDTFGAEKLMGKGDMLYKPAGASASRVQGSFVSDEEVFAFTDYIREHHKPEYDESIREHVDKEASKQKDAANMVTAGDDDEGEGEDGRLDGLLNEAIQMAIEDGQTSTSMLQRRLRIGYARAGRLVDEMEKRGVVSAQDGSKPRKTLMTREQYYEMVSESEE